MTKSIEEQAREYVSNYNEIDIDDVGEFGTDIHMFLAGAKARDAQFLAVVNELRDSLNCIAVDVCFPSNVIAKKAIAKADQLLKGMGI